MWGIRRRERWRKVQRPTSCDSVVELSVANALWLGWQTYDDCLGNLRHNASPKTATSHAIPLNGTARLPRRYSMYLYCILTTIIPCGSKSAVKH